MSVYCARRIPAHLMCTQCSILLHHIDIGFLQCICLWQISQIQTCLCVVVGPRFVSTAPAFMRSTPAIQRVRRTGLPQNSDSSYHCWGQEVSTQFAQKFVTAVTAPPLVCCVVWSHIFNCIHIRTTLSLLDLWTDLAGVTELLARWTEKLFFDFSDMITVAECSVKNNSPVCWGWSVLKFFSAPRDIQLTVGLTVSDMEYTCLCVFWVCNVKLRSCSAVDFSGLNPAC